MCCSKELAKLAVLILLPLLLLCYGVGTIHCSTVHEDSIDLQALLDFKKGVTSDPNGALSNWTMSSHFCHWNGVMCALKRRPLRVVCLILTGKCLSGQISSSLGNLTFLNTLDLSDNNFFGSLPFLGSLQQLLYLYLNNNNNLSGTIPDALTNCSSLIELDISSNSLAGSIYPKFGLLSNLEFISLAHNQIAGTIPSELSQLKNLEHLILGYNRLSGEIPHSIFSLSSLKSLGLEYNMLAKASLPPNIGELFPNLTQITLENNSFEGPIPASLGNALRLQMIDLSRNNFSGQIPPSLGNLTSLTILNLNDNQLVARDNQDWEFLNALRNCRTLKYLELSYNELQGPIPLSISNLSTSLQHLLLTGNNLSGIPRGIGNLSALIRLGLGENYFNGTTEGWIESLKSLQVLLLQSNNFTGTIPSFNNFTQLTYLSLSGNGFDSSIPANLGNLRGLLQLDLSYNNLQGHIPPNFGNLEQLILFDLSHNNLQGAITLDISKIKQLTDLRLSSNKLTGEIPDTFGKCQQLETLLMDQNDLIGNIPLSFKGLQSLKSLNLSHNNLCGTIPTILEDLSLLNRLDISYNHLQGEIPMNGVFANATAISLNDNWGLCGGAMDLHMPACSAVSWVIECKHYLTILLILVFGFTSLGISIYVIFLGKKAPRRPYLLLLSFGKKFPRVTYKDLAQATVDFSEFNLVGRGSYGSVYRGKLTQAKIEVAIKVFDLETRFAGKSFISECESLRTIRHRNLLPILTACSTIDNNGNDFKALIYEFMPNGNLDTELHQKRGGVAPKVSKQIEWKSNLFRLLISIFGFMSLVLLIYIIVHPKQTSRRPYLLLLSFGKKFPVVSYKDLAQATGNFSESNLIGRGSYGSVYKGKLSHTKIQVAINVFDLEIRYANRSFVSECEVFRDIPHQNLLPILTACSTIDNTGNDFKALIYEFMHNGNLDTWLHHRRACVAPKGLSLFQRINIIVDIADALAYLHHGGGRPIVHCDLKPTNILLDDDMNAYLGDFGIASLILDSRPTTLEHSCCNSSVAVTGTIGYIPPGMFTVLE